eukprot:TRINITY_DN4117_c0_g1_i1.p1 TRINITY_DN4117_c0_g1~~TRINITY_DN4117_c0_g1_i1.p1  ORF type:complete len:962 (+),score=171.47 TRINITY_DN4117_c0_g1_i1:80-2965(+)
MRLHRVALVAHRSQRRRRRFRRRTLRAAAAAAAARGAGHVRRGGGRRGARGRRACGALRARRPARAGARAAAARGWRGARRVRRRRRAAAALRRALLPHHRQGGARPPRLRSAHQTAEVVFDKEQRPLHGEKPRQRRTQVWTYVSQFAAKWAPYRHRELADLNGTLLTLPPTRSAAVALLGTTAVAPEPLAAPPANAEERCVLTVGRLLYERLYRNHLRKRFGVDPAELDMRPCSPLRDDGEADATYFYQGEQYQFMPQSGFTRLVHRMLRHPNITVRLGVDAFDTVAASVNYHALFYTGTVDALLGYKLGKLQYRSQALDRGTQPRVALPRGVAVIDTLAHPDILRVVDFKRVTGQKHVRAGPPMCERPTWDGEPVWGVPTQANLNRYAAYAAHAHRLASLLGLRLVGGLAHYATDYNPAAEVAQALHAFVETPPAIAAALPLRSLGEALRHSADGLTAAPAFAAAVAVWTPDLWKLHIDTLGTVAVWLPLPSESYSEELLQLFLALRDTGFSAAVTGVTPSVPRTLPDYGITVGVDSWRNIENLTAGDVLVAPGDVIGCLWLLHTRGVRQVSWPKAAPNGRDHCTAPPPALPAPYLSPAVLHNAEVALASGSNKRDLVLLVGWEASAVWWLMRQRYPSAEVFVVVEEQQQRRALLTQAKVCVCAGNDAVYAAKLCLAYDAVPVMLGRSGPPGVPVANDANAAVDAAVAAMRCHACALQSLRSTRRALYAGRGELKRATARLFACDASFVLQACTDEDEAAALTTAASILLTAGPLATIEIVVRTNATLFSRAHAAELTALGGRIGAGALHAVTLARDSRCPRPTVLGFRPVASAARFVVHTLAGVVFADAARFYAEAAAAYFTAEPRGCTLAIAKEAGSEPLAYLTELRNDAWERAVRPACSRRDEEVAQAAAEWLWHRVPPLEGSAAEEAACKTLCSHEGFRTVASTLGKKALPICCQ